LLQHCGGLRIDLYCILTLEPSNKTLKDPWYRNQKKTYP
jgi:hypothetical protein